MSLSLNLYQSMALAVAIFYFGAFLKSKISVFRTYCIPSPVIGGIIYAIVNLILYQTGVLQLSVDTTLQSVFMNVFFTSVGFTAGFGMLKKGGKSLIVFLVAVCILIGIQDVVGAALCKVFGLQPLLGLALGSMPLTGGHGTTTAFAPLLESMGVQNALTVGVAAATYGLVAGNVIGNPLARRRIKKLGLSSSDAAQVDHEALLELNEVDIAEFLGLLNGEEAVLAFRTLPKGVAADVFAELEPEMQQLIVAAATDAELAVIV